MENYNLQKHPNSDSISSFFWAFQPFHVVIIIIIIMEVDVTSSRTYSADNCEHLNKRCCLRSLGNLVLCVCLRAKITQLEKNAKKSQNIF